jgi:hypothetical protein
VRFLTHRIKSKKLWSAARRKRKWHDARQERKLWLREKGWGKEIKRKIEVVLKFCPNTNSLLTRHLYPPLYPLAMNITSISFGYLVFALFIINFLSVILIRAETNFWLTGVIIWIMLFFIVVLLNVMNSKTVDIQEEAYSELTTVSDTQEYALKQVHQQKDAENTVLFRLLGVQTIFSCVWQFIGFSKTGKKYYRKAALTFALLTVIYGLTELFRIV